MEEGRIIAPKRIKELQELTKKGEEDRISALPDCLIIEILTRLPSTKEAVRTGTLSKRWKHIWTCVHTLIFTSDYDTSAPRPQCPNSISKFVSSVNKTLTQCHHLKLKKFQVYIDYHNQFKSQVNDWICYAISRDVEELDLKLWRSEDGFSLNQSFFINTCFTDLTLTRCISYPIGAVSWKKLKRLCISWVDLDEDSIENILSGSPLLETLVLNYCDGYRRLDITSKSVKNLVLDDCSRNRLDDFIEIKAPNILSLTIIGHMWFCKISLLNVSSVIEANLDYYYLGYEGETTPEEEMLKELIRNLRHAKALKIGVKCSKVVSRLEAKGFDFPSNIKFLNNGPKGDEDYWFEVDSVIF